MNSQTSTKQAKTRRNKKTAESAENISAMKRNQNIYNDVPAISSRVVSSGFSCSRIARVISSEEVGTMSKNNFRGITLGRGPIWGIHSLTLIISCLETFLTLRRSKEFPALCKTKILMGHYNHSLSIDSTTSGLILLDKQN